MKKMMFGVAALIVIGITGMTGLLNAAFHMDDISDQEYRISLKKAAAIVKNETKEHNISAIHFAVEKDLENPTNATYEYQFFCEGQVIAVNPSTGKTTVRNDTEKAAEHLFDIEKNGRVQTTASSDEGSSQLLREKSKSERVDTSSQR